MSNLMKNSSVDLSQGISVSSSSVWTPTYNDLKLKNLPDMVNIIDVIGTLSSNNPSLTTSSNACEFYNGFPYVNTSTISYICSPTTSVTDVQITKVQNGYIVGYNFKKYVATSTQNMVKLITKLLTKDKK